jgi:hypothetical protein
MPTKLPCARYLNSRDRDRDAQPRDRDVRQFVRDETETRRWYVSRRDIRDRDHILAQMDAVLMW